jgi:hypothetical protein
VADIHADFFGGNHSGGGVGMPRAHTPASSPRGPAVGRVPGKPTRYSETGLPSTRPCTPAGVDCVLASAAHASSSASSTSVRENEDEREKRIIGSS